MCQWNYKQNYIVRNACTQVKMSTGGFNGLCSVSSKYAAMIKSTFFSGENNKERVYVPFKMFIHMHGPADAHVLVKADDEVIGQSFNPGTSEVYFKQNTTFEILTPVKDVIKSLLYTIWRCDGV